MDKTKVESLLAEIDEIDGKRREITARLSRPPPRRMPPSTGPIHREMQRRFPPGGAPHMHGAPPYFGGRMDTVTVEPPEEAPRKKRLLSVVGSVHIEDRVADGGQAPDVDGGAQPDHGDNNQRAGRPGRPMFDPRREFPGPRSRNDGRWNGPGADDLPEQREERVREIKEQEDESLKKRNKRMFGALLGTLDRFRQEGSRQSRLVERQQEALRRAEEKAAMNSQRLREQAREQEKVQREKDAALREQLGQQADEKLLELAACTWKANRTELSKFLRTAAEPRVFYLPKTLDDSTRALLEARRGKELQEALAACDQLVVTAREQAREAAGRWLQATHESAPAPANEEENCLEEGERLPEEEGAGAPMEEGGGQDKPPATTDKPVHPSAPPAVNSRGAPAAATAVVAADADMAEDDTVAAADTLAEFEVAYDDEDNDA